MSLFSNLRPLPEGWFHNGKLTSPLNTGAMNVLQTAEHGKSNCTDTNAIFGASSTVKIVESFSYNAFKNFWSCAFYPNISRDVRDHRMPQQDVSLLANEMDTTISSSASVVNLYSTCLVAYCDDFLGCESSLCTKSNLVINNTMLSNEKLRGCLYEVCDRMPDFAVNPDIGGPGPTYSYIIQIAMSLSIFLVLGLFFLVIPFTIRFVNRRWSQIDEQKQDDRLHMALEIVLITLEDFQRAQCCFAVTVNVASVITLSTGTAWVSPADRGAIFAASFSGITAPSMVLCVLMAFNQRESALTFWLTFCTWVFSLSVSIMLLLSKQSPRTYPQACGGFSPAHLCGSSSRRDLLDGITIGYLYAPVIFLPFLLMWHNWTHTLRLARRVTSRPLYWPRPCLCPAGINNFHFMKDDSCNGEVVLFMGLLFAINIFSSGGFLYLYPRISTKNHNVLDIRGQDWTFGQIVSLTVWFPVLLSLANNAIYGPVRGRSEQLPDSLKVVRVSTALLSEEEAGIELLNANTSSSLLHNQSTIIAIHERSNTVPATGARLSGEQHSQLERHATSI
jgi:hypothetical protein